MGICSNCIYFGNQIKIGRRTDFLCNNESNQEVDFVTGKIYKGLCRLKNNSGECVHFDDGHIALYAWLYKNNTVFTFNYPVKVNDALRDEQTKILCQITEMLDMFAWKSDESILYTKELDLNEESFVYGHNGDYHDNITEYKEASENVEASIIVDGVEYFRSEKDDCLMTITIDGETIESGLLIRQPELDFNFYPPEEESPVEDTGEPDTELPEDDSI